MPQKSHNYDFSRCAPGSRIAQSRVTEVLRQTGRAAGLAHAPKSHNYDFWKHAPSQGVNQNKLEGCLVEICTLGGLAHGSKSHNHDFWRHAPSLEGQLNQFNRKIRLRLEAFDQVSRFGMPRRAGACLKKS